MEVLEKLKLTFSIIEIYEKEKITCIEDLKIKILTDIVFIENEKGGVDKADPDLPIN